ncbi:hypothetical protein [Amycolatopsis sp. NPDC051071]|uniref:hypothetical protein n=1 Tax=Amycolatopsis sp. NPDC051071 TaxID=3154637 RepID=UPI00341795EE
MSATGVTKPPRRSVTAEMAGDRERDEMDTLRLSLTMLARKGIVLNWSSKMIHRRIPNNMED